ncbi:MAG TPA: peptidylprolyl isomerase [Longimicrobiaceae bacterium]|nr:peptidylprolyl isomerase [Longimicrobiaceae bacterium]
MRTIPLLTALLLAAAPLAAPLSAQAFGATPQQGEQLLDGVAAIVGDTTVLLSDVQAVVQQMKVSGQSVPTDPVQLDALYRQILDNQINDLVLVEAARNQKVKVLDEEVTKEVDARMADVEQKFGSSLAFDQALAQSGTNRTEYRKMLEGQIRDQMLSERLLGQEMRDRAKPVISEDQLRKAFDEHKGELETRPATISLQQVVVAPEPTDSARAKALHTAEDVEAQLAKGADFAVLAKRYSDDPGSKEQGGELGWFRHDGHMVKEFEDMAFALRPNQISPIVKTDYGYHIIQLEKVRGPERQARHILISPEITPADIQRARERADSVKTAIEGGASVLALAEKFNTPQADREVTQVVLSRLPPAYGAALSGAQTGAVVGPIQVEGPRGANFAVVKVTGQQPAGEYTLDDVRDQLTANLQRQAMVQQVIAELKKTMFVKVLM